MNRYVQAPSHGGGFRSGEPHLVVIHCLEAPPRRGIAYDLATGWLQNAGVSPHALTDPGETVDTCDEGLVGWHCGNGNQVSIGLEVTGYAGWSADQWLESEAFAAVRLDAKRAMEAARRHGIPYRWLSLSQIRNGESGFCTHNDISLTYGGTNHWDPGPNFPFAIFMQMVQQWAGGWDGIKDDNKPSTPNAPGPGGADPVVEQDDDMPLILTAPGKPAQLLLVGDRIIGIARPKTRAGLIAAGVKTAEIDPADYDAFRRALTAEVDSGK